MSTPKWSSVNETTLIAASSSGPFSAAIRTDVSSRTAKPSGGGPGVCELAAERVEILLEREVRRRRPQVGEPIAGDPLSSPHGAQLGDRTPRDGDREPLAGLGATQHLADLVAELLLGDGCHSSMVAIVLPIGLRRLLPP